MSFEETIEPGTLELLIKLQKTDQLKNFFLVGGTSLAIQLGHRKSIDLDLFTMVDFDVNSMLEFLEEYFNFKMNYSSKNTLKGSIENIKVDLLSHKYPLVKEPAVTLGIRHLQIEDIAAMKINAIAGDGTRSKDFIDIYFILKHFSIQQLLDFYGVKYETRNLLHVLKSLNYFEDVNLDDWPEMLKEKDLTFSEVRQAIEVSIKNYSESHLKN